MSSKGTIRVGLIGAGANTRSMHIPGFQAIDGVEIVSVANRSRESGEKVAAEFDIPTVHDRWEDVVEDDGCDAVCIGTWPYMHAPMTLKALECGKHVLCEARMAMSAAEAHKMLEASQAHEELVCQIVPSPMTLKLDRTIKDLVAEGYLGKLLAVELVHSTGSFPDYDGDMHWRNDVTLSGFNIMAMGIWYEAIMRWVGPATRVSAMTRVNVDRRKNTDREACEVSVPDHIAVSAEMAMDGALANIRLSSVCGLDKRAEIWLWGSEGALKVENSPLALFGGQRGDDALQPIEVPEAKQEGWRVEDEFIGAIRGEETIRLTTFDDGVRYMEFTEAVTRSSQTGKAVVLPLTVV